MIETAISRILEFFPTYLPSEIRNQVNGFTHLTGHAKTLKRVIQSVDREQMLDGLAEIQFALIFAGLGFKVEIEPLGRKGPDLQIFRDEKQAVVEIMRFRKINESMTWLNLDDPEALLLPYGNTPRDERKAYDKILNKFAQVGSSDAIIAIWNDDEDLEEMEVQGAVASIREDALRRIFTLPPGLSFVLYGSKWVRAGDQKQLYCFPFRYHELPHLTFWQEELAQSTVGELIRIATNELNSGLRSPV